MKKIKNKKTTQQITEALRKRCVVKAKVINKINSGYKCQYCGIGKPKQIHSHHIFHEGINKGMSADVDNLICLCARHHATGEWNRTNGFNFHSSPAEAMEWFREKYPELYKTLNNRRNKTNKMDWNKKLIELKGELCKLKKI
jgi:hypothetical protein